MQLLTFQLKIKNSIANFSADEKMQLLTFQLMKKFNG